MITTHLWSKCIMSAVSWNISCNILSLIATNLLSHFLPFIATIESHLPPIGLRIIHEFRVFFLSSEETSIRKYKMFVSGLQVVRSRLQEQGHHSEKRYSGVIDCIRKVFQQEGLSGFYRGCATNLLRTTPAAVITFTSFEMIHRFLVSLSPSDPQ